MNEKKYVIPWVKKESVTIVATEDTGSESNAIRDLLEHMNYRVDMLFAASRKEFMAVLTGKIKTEKYLVFCTHGMEEGISMPDEEPVSPEEIKKEGKLSGKVIVNTGCDTGRKSYGDAFIKGAKAKAYIAPQGYPEGSVTALFVGHLFYELQPRIKSSIKSAVAKSRKALKDAEMFKLYTR